MNDNLMILAGGASSRMKLQIDSDVSLSNEEKQQSNSRSKSLISIDNSGRPLMDYLLYNAKKAGYKKIYIITGEKNELFKTFYGTQDCNNNFHDLNINFAIQFIQKDREKPLGTADAVYQAYMQYPELKINKFTVCNSDNLYSVKALQLLRESSSAPNALISYDREALEFAEDRIAKFALMLFDENQYLVDIVEKPSLNQSQVFLDKTGKLRVSMNVFMFDGALFFDYVKNCPINRQRNEKELPTALLNMIQDHPNSVLGIPLSEHVPDLTSKQDIAVFKEYIKKSYKELKW
jgi:glucose-1-phosphate adenylyltransferase